MESIVKIIEKYAVVFNVNLLRATLNEASEFKDYLEETIRDTDKEIVVNLSNCEHLDSTFLGVLVNGYKRLKSKNRNLVIIEPIKQSSIFLTLNSIGKIFPLYTDVKSALEDIENKKLLELELVELESETEKSDEKFEDTSFTITEQEIEESVEGKNKLQTENLETKPETFNLEPKPIEETNNIKQENFVMGATENLEKEKDLELISYRKVTEEFASFISYPENGSESEIVEDVEPFRKGTVKWEFGFN